MPSAGHILSPNLWKKHYSLVPVVAICGGACVMGLTYIGYMAANKKDVSFRPSRWLDHAPYKFVNPEETTRLLPFSKPIAADPEIVALRKEIGSYRAN